MCVTLNEIKYTRIYVIYILVYIMSKINYIYIPRTNSFPVLFTNLFIVIRNKDAASGADRHYTITLSSKTMKESVLILYQLGQVKVLLLCFYYYYICYNVTILIRHSEAH